MRLDLPYFTLRTPQTPASASSSTGGSGLGRLQILDDLIRLRAADAIQVPILAYPQHGQHHSYAYFCGRDLDAMIHHTSWELSEYGIKPVCLQPLSLKGVR